MKPETRLKIALHHTIITCSNFKDKDIDKILIMLSNWDLEVGKPVGGVYSKVDALFQKTFPTPDSLVEFVVSVEYGYINQHNLNHYRNIIEFLMRTYGESLESMTEIKTFLKVIERKAEGPRENYCWDSETILLDKPAYKSEIGWLLLGPGFKLRQGQLSKEAMHARIDTLLGENNGSNT